MTRAAVFLDRDGVLIREKGLLTRCEDVELLPDAASAVRDLRAAGFLVVVVTNQTIVARGLASTADVEKVHSNVQAMLGTFDAGIDAFYYCPHHPQATLPEYRVDCECRKPRPGMLLRAAAEHDLDLSRSYMVGDRISDVAAGNRAGCYTIQVRTGEHEAVPIESSDNIDNYITPLKSCESIGEAARLILGMAK
jgi:D-glycero-D-manno-heptose 1,7-bisphosphate phosphatase